jgi:hypothetical protein
MAQSVIIRTFRHARVKALVAGVMAAVFAGSKC